jgi:DNA-binding NtrC family response regulator
MGRGCLSEAAPTTQAESAALLLLAHRRMHEDLSRPKNNSSTAGLERHWRLGYRASGSALPDGDGRRVLEIVRQSSPNVEVIVRSRLADPKLWLDVLEQGGYDVLVEPHQCADIQRIVEGAAVKRYMRSHAQAIVHKRKAARGWTA